MKMKIENIKVEQFKSGPREGEYKTFELAEGAVVLKSFGPFTDLGPLHLVVAVPSD